MSCSGQLKNHIKPSMFTHLRVAFLIFYDFIAPILLILGDSGDDLPCFVEFCREICGNKSKKGFHKSSTDESFMKVFHKIPVFFEGWLPLAPCHGVR